MKVAFSSTRLSQHVADLGREYSARPGLAPGFLFSRKGLSMSDHSHSRNPEMEIDFVPSQSVGGTQHTPGRQGCPRLGVYRFPNGPNEPKYRPDCRPA